MPEWLCISCSLKHQNAASVQCAETDASQCADYTDAMGSPSALLTFKSLTISPVFYSLEGGRSVLLNKQ